MGSNDALLGGLGYVRQGDRDPQFMGDVSTDANEFEYDEQTTLQVCDGNVAHVESVQCSTDAPTSVALGKCGQDKRFNNTCPSDDWPKQSFRPDSQERWQQRTAETLGYAKKLAQEAQKHLDAVDQGMKGKQVNLGNNLTAHVKKRMHTTEETIKAVEDRIESVEDTIRQVGESLFSLQRSQRLKWAPLNVCERRLELREARPPQELTRDHCQEALESERQVLINARQELADKIVATKDALIALDSTRVLLYDELQAKRQYLRYDRSCLIMAKSISGQARQGTVLPPLQDASQQGQQTPDTPNNSAKTPYAGPIHDTRQILAAAMKLEEDALRLTNASDVAMLQTKRETTRATSFAHEGLSRRYKETEQLKKSLEMQMHEIDEAITQTELSIVTSRRKCDNIKGEICRGEAAEANTNTSDDVQDNAAKGSVLAMRKAGAKTADQLQTSRALLEQLKAAKWQMMEDIRCKMAALKIDDACIRVTPRKSIELNRSDPRGGRCMLPSKKSSPQRKPDSIGASTTPRGGALLAEFA